MTKKLLKSRSKRQSCRQKYKVEKKVKEHLRKTKKEARRNPKHKKKDPGVPNSLPFKAEILLQAEAMKAENVAEKRAAADLQRLVSGAQQRQRAHERKASAAAKPEAAAAAAGGAAKQVGASEHAERSAKAFHREFAKVVAAADVLLEVLDARDPLGSRCREMEEAVLGRPDKRLVLVLNKADLVPREVLRRWVAHLRRELPCVAFRCSTQAQRARIGQRRQAADAEDDAAAGGSRAAGVEQLLGLLANYGRGRGGSGGVVVGVVGYPNTGKSSLINSLKRARVCPTGATPGLTRVSQEVALDKRVRLLDCPGVVLAGGAPAAQLILRNCVRVETVDDPLPAVQAIVAKCAPEKLMVFYCLPQFRTAEEFLALLARRLGKLKRGGRPDTAAAGRKVLTDWSSGRLTYYTLPPETQPAQSAHQLQLVSQWSSEFSLDSVDLLPGEADGGGDSLGRAPDAMDAVVEPLESVAMATPVGDENEAAENGGDGDAAMETDEEAEAEGGLSRHLVVDASEAVKSSGGGANNPDAAAEARFRADMAGAQRNRSLRLVAKKSRKRAKRLDKAAGRLGGEFEAKMDTVLTSLAGGVGGGDGGSYDFEQHFPPAKK